MMKKLWLVLVCAALSVTCFLFGCGKGNGNGSSNTGNLIDYVDETEDVAYGSAYVLETLVRDDSGTIYEATYTVKDSSGASVVVERGKFLALDKNGYTVTYSVTTPKATFSRKVTINVVNGGVPAIEMSATDETYMFGDSFTVPEISVYDYYDGEIKEYTVEFFKKNDGTDVKFEDYVYSPEQPFPLTQSGDHYMKVTAKNSAGTVAEARREFFVRAEMLAGEYDCFSDKGCLDTSRHMASVSARNWHETYRGRQGVLSFDVGATNSYRNLIHVTAKGNQTAYADYEYIAVSMYIEAEEGAFTNLELFPPVVGEFALKDIVYNDWNTYYFPNQITWAEKSMNICGTTVSPATVYIDGIFFTDEIEGDVDDNPDEEDSSNTESSDSTESPDNTESSESPDSSGENSGTDDPEITEGKLLTVNDAMAASRFGAGITYREYSYFVNLGIEMSGNYTGGSATKFFCEEMSVTLDMTKDELARLKGSYNAVKFNLMMMNPNAKTSDAVGFTNFTLITYTRAVWNFNTWYEITVSIDDVVAAMQDKTLSLFSGAAKVGLSPTFCFGDIELTNVTETNDPVLVAAKAENVAYYTNSKAADALNSPVSGKYDETLQRIVVAYDGNPGAANAIFLTLNDTAEALQAKSEKYGYTKIKFTFMVNAAESNTSGKITFSGLFGELQFAATKTDGYMNYRQEYEFTVSVADVVAAMNACTLKQNTFLLMQVDERTGGSPTGFCFGNVEFVA